jgi:hypothetical protein
MKPNNIIALLGAVAGVVLACGAVYAAYRGNLVPAIILVACHATGFVILLRTFLARSPGSRACRIPSGNLLNS